jgi:putative transposase/transposase-like zinc-binding protein
MEAKGPGLLQTILRDHWPRVEPLLSRRLPPAVAAAARAAVAKARRCRTLANGFVRYRCLACEAFHTVCFSCKSRCCPTCGKVRAAQAATNAQGRLLNVRHRHLTFAVPAELRPLLFHDRSLLHVVAHAAAQATLKAVGTRCRCHPPLPGVMATVHTFGRDLTFHVHVHVLCTEGGRRADNVWQPVKLFPVAQYRKLWQYYLLTGLRRKRKGNRGAQRLIGRLFRQYPRGFMVNVASRYANGRKAAAYGCRYTGRPPLSERRIVAYDGQQVTFTYQDYRDGLTKRLTLPASEFLLRWLQHVWPRYQRDVHYYGLYQPARRQAHVAAVVRASRYGDQARPRPALSGRDRFLQALAGQMLPCPACGAPLVVDQVQFPSSNHEKASPRSPPSGTGQLSLPV